MGKILNMAGGRGRRMFSLTTQRSNTRQNNAPSHTNRVAATGRGKGQMFIIAAIFVIIGFIALRGLLSLPVLTQEKTFQDTSYLDRNLKNIKNEYAYAASVAALQPDVNKSGAGYFFNLSSYLRGQFDSQMLYVFIFSNGTTGNFTATIGNFLQNNISGTLNATGSTPAGRTFSLNDTKSAVLEFNASAAWINVTLNYTLQNRETIERLYFNSSQRNYAAAFFDVTLQESGFSVRTKSVYNRTWFDRA